jgi:hypothetical protein
LDDKVKCGSSTLSTPSLLFELRGLVGASQVEQYGENYVVGVKKKIKRRENEEQQETM